MDAPGLNVEVVYSPAAGSTDLVALDLHAGATVADALAASGLLQRHALQALDVRMGIWGKPCGPQALLRDRDRVEIYRPLQVDPMEARRLRQQRQKRQPSDKTVNAPR